ncbi:metal ABC transporter solute-binding protein, Zn/Mn family [Cellulomonas uda]|uniref:Metal ABC transporter substrate-binding protein n=1 Tax=Cellulomonas uda TaxID=1714 RepID=A0A4Y3KBJ1_CELUD|nr:zinc ABC transporter substrate-binding protein [Cellulomonas uda]NII65163.1 zinc/manganese transport system substrate-binding protein [Cellulomonas uda]GEA80210.1 metal ABC transporter substrate-binding protein [Cellulomonas uda]
MRARAATSLARRGAGALVLTLALAACSSDDGPGAGSDEATLSVVASTNVWGDVVRQVGGDLVEVTSVVDDPSVDPHSFEANARVELAMSRADLVIVNGGGYDDFASQLLEALDQAPPVVVAVDSHAAEDTHAEDTHAEDGHAHGEGNEHVWYDPPTVEAVALDVADELAALAPEHAAQLRANADAFVGRLAELEQRAARLAEEHGGAEVLATEPVPLFLVEAAGLVDRTPPPFSAAVEEETDVPPAAMSEMLDLVSSPQVAFLVYNEQTTGPQTDQVLEAAQAAGLPVVDVTETLPEGEDYVSWMAGNLDAFAQALA